MKRINNNKRIITQIPVSHSTHEEYRELVKALVARGYKLCHGLDDIKDSDIIVAVLVDNEEKVLVVKQCDLYGLLVFGEKISVERKEISLQYGYPDR